jgi:hypothetical protein
MEISSESGSVAAAEYSWRNGCRYGWRYKLRKGLVNLFVGVEVLTRF